VDALKSGAPAGESIYFAVYKVAAEMCLGREVTAKVGDAGVRAMHKLQREMLLALPSFTAVAMYPRICKLLFPSRWSKLVAFWRQLEEFFLPIIAEIKSRKASHGSSSNVTTYVESLLDLRIHELSDRQVTDGQLVSLVTEFIGNASDSTGAAVEWAMANLVKHPDVQKKLRTEIKAIARGEGFIEEADLSRMLYLRAVVLETLRRHPTIPFVMRHVEGDEAANALGVPRMPHGGTTVNFLVGKISRNPAVWSDPMSFSPERFMPGGEAECIDLTGTREIKMMPFGAGRRVCPGMELALLHVGYFVANLVREFEWLEADGDEAVHLAEYHGFPFGKKFPAAGCKVAALQAPLDLRHVSRY
jgi:cytochrome P450